MAKSKSGVIQTSAESVEVRSVNKEEAFLMIERDDFKKELMYLLQEFRECGNVR